MNNPEYILEEVLGEIVEAARVTLGLANLNYQYGYIMELDETLQQWSKLPDLEPLKFPLVWLRQPYAISRGGVQGIYGTVEDLGLFIMHGTNVDRKAKDRLAETFKPTLFPIYRAIMDGLENHIAIRPQPQARKHRKVIRYYWGNEQQNDLTDRVDCIEVSQLQIEINDNPNCFPFKNI